MKCTLPSANRKLHPPGWLLVEAWYCPSDAFEFDRPKSHQLTGYWIELGGMIVLNRLKAPMSSAQRNPFWFWLPALVVVWAARPTAHAWRSVMTALKAPETSY